MRINRVGSLSHPGSLQAAACFVILVIVSFTLQGCGSRNRKTFAPEQPPQCVAAAIDGGEIVETKLGDKATVLCPKGFSYSGPELECIAFDQVCYKDKPRKLCRRLGHIMKCSMYGGKEAQCESAFGFGEPGSAYEGPEKPSIDDVPVVEGLELAEEVALGKAEELEIDYREKLTTKYKCNPSPGGNNTSVISKEIASDDSDSSEAKFLIRSNGVTYNQYAPLAYWVSPLVGICVVFGIVMGIMSLIRPHSWIRRSLRYERSQVQRVFHLSSGEETRVEMVFVEPGIEVSQS